MHTLGDQWVEIIDGQEHLVKAVYPVFDCQGCMYLAEECCVNSHQILSCGIGKRFILKDLGILKDGMLPCPFCGDYPSTDVDGVAYCNTCGCDIDLDKWNIRV